ncbi:hypothetical protein M1466_03220 [Candidatus Dependentiae bacterium]|nr:hypothetical protein [Candidatus Dependentiae bacterium]
MAPTWNNRLAGIINSNILHAIVSCVIGYSLWLTVAYQLPITHCFAMPIFVCQEGEQRYSTEPSNIAVTVHGKRGSIVELLHNNPSITVQATNTTIALDPAMIALPAGITLVDAMPTTIQLQPVAAQ